MAKLPLRRALALAPLVVAGLAGAFGAGRWYEQREARLRDEWADAKLLSTAIDSVRANALDSLPSDELIRRAVSGMLRELQDPYAALLQGDGVQRYRGALQGDGRGLGLTLRHEASWVSVARVAPESPAHAAGLRAGDRIVAVDGVPIAEGFGRRAAGTNAPGSQVGPAPAAAADAPSGSHVFTVWRAPHGDTARVTVHRQPWHMPAVIERGLLTDSVGYVRLATMSARSAEELEETVESLVQRGATSLVLDLRGNTGGLFEEGVKAAGLFLPRHVVVASLAGRGGDPPQHYRARNSRWPRMPLTVLVDAQTASAAEIVAAALRDYDRALLVGAPTYGKGVVQRVVRLSPELALRLTTARWLTPHGVALERRTGRGDKATGGLIPDVLLDDAARRDAFVRPDGWTRQRTGEATLLADSLAMHALRDGWSIRPLPQLEARLRAALSQMVPVEARAPLARVAWVSATTQMAVARMLEVEREHELLLRYAVRTDAALRAGLDVVAPGIEVAQVNVAPLPTHIGRQAMARAIARTMARSSALP